MELIDIYNNLLEKHGPQGWWPIISYSGSNPTKTGSLRGYHPGDYSFPRCEKERFEICVGAILTQNTNWVNVEKALINLDKVGGLNASGLLDLDMDVLLDAIRPAGYYNQKARKLRIFAEYFLELNGVPSRDSLLGLWGVGPETADSILLYGFGVASFVVDAYTRRVFESLELINNRMSYDEVKEFFEKGLPDDYTIYQEFHALIVEEAKRLGNR